MPSLTAQPATCDRSAPKPEWTNSAACKGVSIRPHIIPEVIRGLAVVATENLADKGGIPEKIPVAELVELPARGDSGAANERAPRAAGFAAVLFQAPGEIDILDRDEARVEAADFVEIPLPKPEQPEAHAGEREVGQDASALATMPTDQRSGKTIAPPPTTFPESSRRRISLKLSGCIRLSASQVTMISPAAAATPALRMHG